MSSIDIITFTPEALVAMIVATSFAAGLNVYATAATLGLLARAGLILLPTGLHPLESWWVIGLSTALFLVEFVADKIPGFDLFWNVVQTFVRVPAGALIAFASASQLSPEAQLLAAALGGLIALAAHGGKLAARAAVTPSPEPFSNVVLSFGEDMLAVFLVWFATRHPFLAAALVCVLLAAIVFTIRLVARALRTVFRRGRSQSLGS